jgi:hypothetical protein
MTTLFTRLYKKSQLPVLQSRLLRRVDKAVEEYAQRVSSEDTKGTTAVKPWGSTVKKTSLGTVSTMPLSVYLQ